MNNVDRYSVLYWMKKDKWMVRKESSIREVMRRMVQFESTELPVIEKGGLLGVIKLQDCVQGLEEGIGLDGIIAPLLSNHFYTETSSFSMQDIVRLPLYITNAENKKFEGAIRNQEFLMYQKYLHATLTRVKPTHRPDKLRTSVQMEEILGESPAIMKAKQMARKAAMSKAPVLLMGESGVGKEQFARAIHDLGMTREGAFIPVNCTAIPDNLLESELFGYTGGAFTGANKDGKPGKFELAHKGTLFLDEIGDLPLSTQVKILRVLQEKEIERIGSVHSVFVDFRLITATNKNLGELMKRGEFREDLYHRLHVIPIQIPPLRQRKTDIPHIMEEYSRRLCATYGITKKTIDEEALRLFFKYDWPGNVRELINVMERMYVLIDHSHIGKKELLEEFIYNFTARSESNSTIVSFQNRHKAAMLHQEEEEKKLIENVLKEVKGNKSKAAERLGISRATLYNKLARFHV
ncbi:sigma 54-interacting transcriptional regulator [Brevibacillus laterosporus]|uniref:Sigma 54-interacting transcriptional regulator n=1 Tax=Brevibacillus laterosporus TaxID=1465 RepID=A0AAP3DGY3_BRELA|nr:sigma 54-interacting transcriptional regulator [Brevibacillus laterosporus]MCR8980617.1 sigma 54-interacting transcriptional regulator [Brevibacillus laterosporus]MCZ0807772.1 sigma 54-interacting transcriptional regulator [Brevibacillus laterosporus]MCZ0826048.1 sigma 54-interacting transcriptional regulator [Brevibacillus laterosporus]MCZ0849785.1 sigma 54-interacting transcriptional regulator [Brevibacillus laterosporus]